jgi:hypothetical protein
VAQRLGAKAKEDQNQTRASATVEYIYRLLGDRFYVDEFELNGKIYQGKHKPMFTEDEFDHL